MTKFSPFSSVSGATFIIGLVLVALMGGLTWIALASSDANFVSSISNLLPPIGLAMAVMLGVAFSNYVSRELSHKTVKATGMVGGVGFALIGTALLWLGASQPLILIPAMLVLLCSVMMFRYSRPGQTMPKAGRYLMVSVALLAGLLPGAIVYFILSFIVSDHYCKLTSSKCL